MLQETTKSTMIAGLHERGNQYMTSDAINIATILDPRFKFRFAKDESYSPDQTGMRKILAQLRTAGDHPR